jgi:hypothetical protein
MTLDVEIAATHDDAGSAPEPNVADHRANRAGVWALIMLATLVVVLSAVNVWVKRQVLDTDNWVDASAALIENDDVRMELSTFLVNELYESVDVGDTLAERLPDDLAGLGSPIATVLRDPLTDAIDVVLQSQAVEEIWRDANRLAHEAAVAILKDDVGTAVSSADGEVTLDLGALVEKVGQELGVSSDILDKIPDDAGLVTIVQSDKLEAAQTAVRIIELLSVLLFFLVVGLYGAAVYLARNWRREAVRNIGVAIALAGFVILVIVQFATGWIVDSAGTSSGQTVSGAVLPIATYLLTRMAWGMVFGGGLIALFAVAVGPARWAQPVQRVTAAGFRRQAAAMWIGVAMLILLVLAWGPVSVPDNWWSMLLIAFLVIAGVEALRRTSLARDETELEEAVGTGLDQSALEANDATLPS